LAINYLHKSSITHRDIKLENILLESANLDEFSIKLADFSFATKFDHDLGFI